ncbi:hypothetical protein CBS101457_004069 [Exobasidium rhododendri]|nr:hypothetical protein CBS101457_004069 [Exobasidium rhododendri]
MLRLLGLRIARRGGTSFVWQRRCFNSSTVVRQSGEDYASKIKSQLKDAMRAKDSFTSTVLRSLLSEQQYAAKAGNEKAAEYGNIIQKAISKRQESSRQFRAAKPAREDLAEKEDREIGIIEKFLPEQMKAEDVEKIVKEVIEIVKKEGVSGKKLMGEVMKGVAAKVDKTRAPGSVISEIVRKLLPKD